MATKTILVAGAHGLIGRTLIEQLETRPDIEVIGLGRRAAPIGRARMISVDLTDAADCRARIGDLAAVTHVVFDAWTARDSRAAEVPPNLAMLRNLMRP